MDKGVGFNRNIFLPWLDAAAAFCAETSNPAAIRARLQPIVGQTIADADNRRKALDILINIWVKTQHASPDLREEAVSLFQNSTAATDRLWLHYGLTLLYYPFFRKATAVIGQLSRNYEAITPALVKARLAADLGQLGSLGKAVERVMFSLRNWGLLADSGRRYAYTPRRLAVPASSLALESWMLACALRAHPAEEIPFADLSRLPELFPFRFGITVDQLRENRRCTIQRHGMGWDMVRVADAVGRR